MRILQCRYGVAKETSAGVAEILSEEAPKREKQSSEQACSTSGHRAFWTGSSTLPRLHQKHESAASGSLLARGGSLIRVTLLPSRVVATSKSGRKAGLGRMATMAFSSTVSTYIASSIDNRIFRRSVRLASSHKVGRFSSRFPASLAASTPGTTRLANLSSRDRFSRR